MGTFAHLRTERADHVLTVTLDRPDRLNAVNGAMAEELRGLLADADHDDGVRAVVLTGAGRGFCAGVDVADLAASAGAGDGGGPAGLRQAMRQRALPLARTLLDVETPLVAAVNGACAGAGMGLALACDVVVASEQATFTMAFVRRGLVPDYATTYLLPRLVGLRAARELCLLGDTVPAAEAERIGLVTRVVPQAELLGVAASYARRFAEGAGVALRLTKRLLSGSFDVDAATALDREFTAQALCFASADAAEGARAFMEKRPARFAWR
jgi:2-(1,2-epoxy-1,2-dihydrophenyl)acetyl-CoA isomerase